MEKPATVETPIVIFKPIEMITLVTKTGELYEQKSIYNNMIKILWEGNNQVHINGLGKGQITMGPRGKLEINISSDETDNYQKIMAMNLLIHQQTLTPYNFSDTKKTEAINMFMSLFSFDQPHATSILDKLLKDSRVSFKIIGDNDIADMGWEERYNHIKAIMRTLGGHDEEISFYIGPSKFFIKPDRLKVVVGWKTPIANLDQSHVFTEEVTKGGEKTTLKMAYVKKNPKGELSSVAEQKHASLNLFQYGIYLENAIWNAELKRLEKKLERVWVVFKEHTVATPKNETVGNPAQPKQELQPEVDNTKNQSPENNTEKISDPFVQQEQEDLAKVFDEV